MRKGLWILPACTCSLGIVLAACQGSSARSGAVESLEATAPKATAERGNGQVDRFGDPLPQNALARLGTVRLRHPGGIHSVAFSPDGKIVASGGWDGPMWKREGGSGRWDDGTVHLWEAATGKEIHILKGHGWSVNSVVFSPDGKTVASGGSGGPDGTVRLWEVATGKEIRTLRGHKDGVISVAFSSDGKTMASAGSWDGTVRLWEAATGKEIHILEGHERRICSVAFSPDGKTVVSGGLDDSTVRLWEAATGKEIRILKGDVGDVNPKGLIINGLNAWVSVAFSPDGRTLAATSNYSLLARQPAARGDKLVQLWDLLSGTALPSLAGHRGPVRGVTFSPDGRVLASVSDDTTGLIWDLTYGAAPPAMKPSPEALATLWADLASQDAVRARRAVWTLVAIPAHSVPLLRDRLQPASGEAGKRLARLVADLDADEFQVRQKAQQELEKLGPEAESALRKGLEGSPSLEMRKRAEQLLRRLGETNKLRGPRAVWVLEQINTPEAHQMLKTLTAGAAGLRLTQEAQAALSRLEAVRRLERE